MMNIKQQKIECCYTCDHFETDMYCHPSCRGEAHVIPYYTCFKHEIMNTDRALVLRWLEDDPLEDYTVNTNLLPSAVCDAWEPIKGIPTRGK